MRVNPFLKKYLEVMESIGEKNKDFFWPSYVDLMTGLFAVVLVLFVRSFKLFKDKEKEITAEKNKYQVLASQYERIRKVESERQLNWKKVA